MAPNRGIAAHFSASKASISRSKSSRSAKAAKPSITKDATSVPITQQSAAKSAKLDDVAAAAELPAAPTSASTAAKPMTPKKPTARRQIRSRLRMPEEGEVDRIMAELQSSPTRIPPPPPQATEAKSVNLLGTPPCTPGNRATRFASPLLEPTTTSRISVRTDPDTNKMFLMLPKSPSKAASAATPATSSPTKRKLRTPPKSTSPTKTPRNALNDSTPRQLITGEPELPGTEEEDGLVLTPGRSKGTRVVLGSPSKSPLIARAQGGSAREQALRRIVAEDIEEDEEAVITPRSVRERAKGYGLAPMATANAAAVFRGASVPSSSSGPQLAQRKEVEREIAALPSNSLTHTEIESETKASEVELPEPKHILSTDLALPSFYSSILTLHMALEHALVVHLATAGAASSTLQSCSSSSSSDEESDMDRTRSSRNGTERKLTKTVRLPNLISYTALRPLVERSGGRRLGPTELGRLASVWVDFQRSQNRAEEEEEVRGLGFIISKTRSINPRTGRRALDWGIGIELEIKRTVRACTPPPQVGFGGVEVQASPMLASDAAFDESVEGTPKLPSSRFTTPPPSPSLSRGSRGQFASSPLLASPQRRRKGRALSPTPNSPKVRSSTGLGSMAREKAREGMSVVAMWNNGLETRKAEVGRRLRERCARYHQLWLDEKGISVPPPVTHGATAQEPATPSGTRTVGLGVASVDSDDEEHHAENALPREAIMGAGGLLTPSATRSGGHKPGNKRIFHLDPSELLSEEEEEDLEVGPQLQRREGKALLIDEVSHTIVRSSKSMLSLRAAPSAVHVVEGEMPQEGSEIRTWHPDFPLNDARTVHPIPPATLPSLAAPPATPHRPRDKCLLQSPSTPHKPVKFTTKAAVVPPSTPQAQCTAGLSLRERIAAKESLRRTSSLPSINSLHPSSSHLTPMQALSQRALISRLPELSSILFMLFSNGTTLSSNGVTRSPTIPMQELLGKLGKSVKIQMSTRECRTAIDALRTIAPGFLVVLGEGGKEYVRVGNNQGTGRLWRLNEVREAIAGELNK
ncbi:uncharacterized protein UBRO_07241 [Ustilago bromivora]|uniref:DNA replication factor Cdt1 C-terminal domain-containing protein n=1 Tax=Ustilago bromivora TaxID=307758 RepID=A0A1K0GCT7_9BASI|nr:uncharacterized protein UBRO_07241 [Ustilago bromivora]SYW76289.1 uncharacterized protein UBRO2_01360 [Ustilago bromivora]